MADKQQNIDMSSQKKSSSFPRRTFINPKFWLGILGGTYIGLKGLEESLYKSISLSFDNPHISDESIETLLEIAEKAPDSENHNFRPLVEIINEGVKAFEEKTGSSVKYIRPSSYRDKGYYQEAVEEITKFSILPPSPETLAEKLSEYFPPEAKLVYYSSNSRISQYEDLFDLSSGFYSTVFKDYPDLFNKQGEVKDYTTYFSVLRKRGKEIIDRAVNVVEVATNLNEAPVSASVVLEHFLNENNGDLGKSIYDTYLFLKFMARNDRDTGFNNTTNLNVEWMRKNIKDEYQGPSFMESGADDINIVGKPYHSWNLAAMLQFFPLEFVRASGIYRQAITLKDQGLGKTRADLQTLKDLRITESLLLSYS